jgi:hypothetical protein
MNDSLLLPRREDLKIIIRQQEVILQIFSLRHCHLKLPPLQKLQQCLPWDADLPTDANASYLAAADQLVGGVAADAKDGHQVLYPQCHGEVA